MKETEDQWGEDDGKEQKREKTRETRVRNNWGLSRRMVHDETPVLLSTSLPNLVRLLLFLCP